MNRNERLQSLCRDYLRKLRRVASRHGLLPWVDRTIDANLHKRCNATELEVELLSRAVDEERLTRREVPVVLGKSYRQSVKDGDLLRVKTLRRVGIYSKVSALLLKKK